MMLAVVQSSQALSIAASAFLQNSGQEQQDSDAFSRAFDSGLLVAYTHLRALGYSQEQVQDVMGRHKQIQEDAQQFVDEGKEAIDWL